MDYTEKQYSLMEKLKNHTNWDDLSCDEKSTLQYLDTERIAVPRADIADGVWTLSDYGYRVLFEHNDRLKIANQKASDKAEQKAEKHREHAFQIFLVFLGYTLGIFTPHVSDIFTVVCNLIRNIVILIGSFF